MALIPHLDNTIRLALDRLNWWQDVVDEELRVRLQLCMGYPDYFAAVSYGVVSETDPAADLAGESGELIVSASAGTTTSVDVNPGMSVTKSGLWMRLTSVVRQIPLADPTPGIPNVIYMAYGLQSSPLQENDFEEWVSPVSARYGDSPQLSGIFGLITPDSAYLKVDKVTTYTTYGSSTTINYVPLAIATVQEVNDPILGIYTILSIDHTRDNYDWNRPWFSCADVAHRAQIGTGVQSVKNPHAVGQNEVTAGDFTPFQIALNHGMVLAKDVSFEKIPGYRCEATYLADQLDTDLADGTYTGYPNSKFFRLPNYPVRVGKCWLTPSGNEVGGLHVPRTNRVVFPNQVLPAGETLHVYYTRVNLCEPPLENLVTFSTNNPSDGELLIAGGLAFEALASTEEAFSDSYQFPMDYHVFVDAEGSLRRTPQVMYCLKRLDLIGTQDVFTISQYAPGKVMIGLAGAAPGFTEVRIRVNGTNSAGATFSNSYSFTGATWTPVVIGSTSMPVGSVLIGSDVFSGLTSFVVENRDGDGSNSSIMIWCIQSTYDSYSKMKDAALIADVMWDGYKMAKVRDLRVVETTNMVHLGDDSGTQLLEFAANQFAGGRQSLYLEDFRRPTLHVLEQPSTWSTTSILRDLPPWNMSKLQGGLYGAYRTKALPVLSGSGFLWRTTFLPLRLETGVNEFVAPAPRFRYRVASRPNWSSWKTMSSVVGMLSTYEFDTFTDQAPAVPEVPVAVQLETDPYPRSSFILYG